MVWAVRAKTDRRFFSVPKFTKYNTILRYDHRYRPEPKYNGLFRWQHIAAALRKNGPMTFTRLWNKVKTVSGIRTMAEMKIIMEKMRDSKMLNSTPPSGGNIKRERWYFYLTTDKRAWQFQYPEKMERARPLPRLPFKVFPYEKPTPLNTYNIQTARFMKETIAHREGLARKWAAGIALSYSKSKEAKKKKNLARAEALKNKKKKKSASASAQ